MRLLGPRQEQVLMLLGLEAEQETKPEVPEGQQLGQILLVLEEATKLSPPAPLEQEREQTLLVLKVVQEPTKQQLPLLVWWRSSTDWERREQQPT